VHELNKKDAFIQIHLGMCPDLKNEKYFTKMFNQARRLKKKIGTPDHSPKTKVSTIQSYLDLRLGKKRTPKARGLFFGWEEK
jgi:hypothetical protein